MSTFYKKPSNLYVKGHTKPWKISRSKIELFMGCKRCFYLDRKLGVARPPGFPFSLNSCVDTLLKKEFDGYRAKAERHPIMPKGSVPLDRPEMNVWRENFKGVQYHHPDLNFLVTGAVDDLWLDSKGQVNVVDYKSTSKVTKIEALDQDWHDGYKRQMEIYQWLLRRLGLDVSNSGYFVYANGNSGLDAFNAEIKFDVTLIEHVGNDSWVEGILFDIKNVLDTDKIPDAHMDCDYCNYVSTCRDLLIS